MLLRLPPRSVPGVVSAIYRAVERNGDFGFTLRALIEKWGEGGGGLFFRQLDIILFSPLPAKDTIWFPCVTERTKKF